MADRESKVEKIKNFYKKVDNVFKAGPIVRHRLASKITPPGESIRPTGTAAAFLKATSNTYASHLASYGQYSRLARYSDYQEMETMAELNSALDIYADEATCMSDDGQILQIESSNPAIKEILTSLFYDILNIEFNAWRWIRNMCKYGDQFLLVDHHPDYGVLGVLDIPVNEMEREEGYDPKDPMAYRFRWVTQGNTSLKPWQIIHLRMGGNDNFLPYGSSVLESARRVWRQLILMEDAVMVYRIVRSPERRVFYIDVGGIPPHEVSQYIEKVKTQLKRNMVVDSNTGRVDLRYNALSTDEDYFIPVRGGDTATKIDTLAGGQFTGDIEDLQYIQNKLFAALKIPKSYLGYEGEVGSKSQLSQEDVRFARTIQRIQRVFITEMNRIAVLHLMSTGLDQEQLINFEIKMTNPSTISEIQKLELWRTRLEVAGIATEGIFDRYFMYKKLFRLNDEEIEAIEEGRKKDRLIDLQIEAVTIDAAAPEEEVPAEPAAEEPSAEEPTEEPPQTDAGEESPRELQPEPEERPITAGRDPNQQVAGPNSILKGGVGKLKPVKPLPDLGSRVFNLKKNGMDPRDDLVYLKRIATTPFGESFRNTFSEILKANQKLNSVEQEDFNENLFLKRTSQLTGILNRLSREVEIKKKRGSVLNEIVEQQKNNKEKKNG
jgi:hypothetical protein